MIKASGWRRLGGAIVLALVILVAFGGLALWAWLRASLPQLSGGAVLSGLQEDVVIERDADGVPVILASSRLDAVRALGWLHGQDRYFQMDLSRRAGAGELSALVGAGALEYDLSRRFHPGRRLAQAAVSRLSPDERKVIEAYTSGVNAGVGALKARPPEYLRPGIPFERWKMEDCFLVALSMWYDLQYSEGELDESRHLLRAYLPASVSHFLFNHGSAWDAPLDGVSRPLLPIPVNEWAEAIARVAGEEGAFGAAGEEKVLGSNAWASGGEGTVDGRAILANDMHLSLRVPHVFYRAGMRTNDPQAGSVSVDGATLPGLPVFIVGSNRHVAWGFTNSYTDTTDLILLERHATDPGLYRSADGWSSFAEREETIFILGGEPHVARFQDTPWGPVREGADGHVYAVAWIASDPAAWNLGLRDMETVSSMDAAISLAHRAGVPTQNCVIADAEGNIAWTIMGPLPDRAGREGAFPLTVDEWESGWNGVLDSDKYPVVRNPPHGRIWTANQRILGGESGKLLGDGGYDASYRAYRIHELITDSPQSESTMLAIQRDIQVDPMKRWRDLIVNTLESFPSATEDWQAQAASDLREWNGEATAESRTYPVLRQVRAALIQRAWRQLLLPLGGTHDGRVLWSGGGAFEEVAYAMYAESLDVLAPAIPGSWAEVILEEIEREWLRGEHLEWGAMNRLKMQHPVAMFFPVLGRWLDMPPNPLSGDVYTVRVHRPAFGSSQRMVVSPGREEQGFYHQPGGPSGHFLSPFYQTGHDDWVHAKPSPFLPGPAAYVLRLEPDRETERR